MQLHKMEHGISISMLHKQHGMHPEMLRSAVLQGHPTIFERSHSSEEVSDDLKKDKCICKRENTGNNRKDCTAHSPTNHFQIQKGQSDWKQPE